MSGESPKKSFAQRLLLKIAGGHDLSDDKERARAIDLTIEKYLDEYRRSTDSSLARQTLNELAMQFEEAGLSPIPIYKAAYERNKADTELLKFIVGEYDREPADERGAVESFWALTVAEPSDLRHFLRLIEHYQGEEDALTLLRIEEQIVERQMGIGAGKFPPPPDPVANEEIFTLALEDLAESYSEMGRDDAQSAIVYEQRYDRSPNDNTNLEMLARAWLVQERSDAKALTVFEQYFVLQPQDPKLLRALSEAYLVNDQAEKAIVLLENLYHSDDDDFGLLSRIVNYYLSRGIINEASINYLKRFADVRSDDAHVHRIIAEFYSRREATSGEAATWYRKVLGDPAEDWTFRLLLSRYFLEEEDWLEAHDHLEPLKGTPHLKGAGLIAFATALANLDRLDAEAAHYYELALEEGSRSRAIFTSLCRAYIRLKRFDPRALRVFEQAVELDPNSTWAYFGLAAYYFKMGEPLNAFRYAIRHIRNNREDEAGIRMAGLALSRSLNEEALLLLETLPSASSLGVLWMALEENPRDGRLLLPLGRVYHHNGEASERAMTVFEHLIAVYPDDVIVRDQAATLALELGREEDGLRHLRRLAMMAGHADLRSEFADDFDNLRSTARAALRRMTTIILGKKVLAPEDEQLLRLSLRLGSNDPLLYRRLALLCAERNEYGAEVLPIYEEALRHYPELTTLKHLAMRCYVTMGKSEPVFHHARELLENQPYNKVVLSLVIDCLASADCFDEDLHDLICEHSRERPDDAGTSIAYALLNFRANRFDQEAADVLERAIPVASDELKVMLLSALARCFEELGEHDRAIETYAKIVPIIPDDRDIIRRLALNHVLHSKTATMGTELIIQALSEGHYDTDLYGELGELFLNRGEVRLLQFVIDQIQERDPNASDRLVRLLERAMRLGMSGHALVAQLAEHYFLSGDRDRALALIDENPATRPAHANAMVELYNIMLVQNGDDLEIRRRRGEMFALMGDRLSAVEDLLAYWDVEGKTRPLPDSFLTLLDQYVSESTLIVPPLMLKMANAYFRSGRFEAAVRLSRQLVQRDPANDTARELLARCHLQLGDLELTYRVAKRLSPGDARLEILYRLACDFSSARNYDRAAFVVSTILDEHDDYRDCRRRARELADLRIGRTSWKLGAIQSTTRQLPPRARERFDLVDEIARTPFRAVYKAYDRELDEIVALKVLSPAFNEIEEAVSRFTSSARAVRRLTHPYVARIRDVGEGGGLAYISMEFLAGGSLRSKIRSGQPLELSMMQRVATQVAEGLDHAHRHEIIHRSLRPANIMLGDFGTAKLTDFGLSALYQDSALMASDLRIDDPRYLAPESLLQGEYTAATDVYAFGLLLYEMLAGRPPFNSGDVAQKHLAMPPPPLTMAPKRLQELVSRCLQKRPVDRFPTMHEVLQELQLATASPDSSPNVA